MRDANQAGTRTGQTIAVLAGLIALFAIVFFAMNVTREMRLLQSARSDTAQWTLAQTEVEFLEFSKLIDKPGTDLTQLRRRFDIFYSRVITITTASVFATLRENQTFAQRLALVQTFLDDAIVYIDAEDATLRRQLPALSVIATAVRADIRSLSNTGLTQFAASADEQRDAVASTLAQLAVSIVTLVALLAVIVVYLNRLNQKIRRREVQQQQTAERMNTVISTSLDGVIVADAAGLILEFSTAAQTIFGYAAADIIGTDLGAIIAPFHMRDAHDAGMERLRRKDKKNVAAKGRIKLEVKRANGDLFPIELAIQSASTESGEIYVAFLRDISNQVAAEAELVATRDKALASEKLKTEFLATMSHEIRTPLNGLMGNMSLLRDTHLNTRQKRFVSHMETSGRLLLSHISDVLDITRYDAGKLLIRSKPMNIASLLQDIIDNQSGTAAANGTTLDWAWASPPMNWIKSDHDRVQHILLNLIGNAVKFTRNGKIFVTVRTLEDGGQTHLHFDIADTGTGMDADLVTRIFDDFVTGNTNYDRDVGGTGLGLSIAKRFAVALGGSIGVHSAPDEGSTFWVRLPIQAALPDDIAVERRGVAIALPEQASARTFQILVVEDNEINRLVAHDMLQADGHTVVLANNGQEGVHTAAATRFDLILMDISMPVMDGRAATRAIRSGQQASAHSPIVALTANAMANEQSNFAADGMQATLTKPLTRQALRALLNALDRDDDLSPLASKPTSHGAALADTAGLIDAIQLAEARTAIGDTGFVKLLGRFVQETDSLVAWLQRHHDGGDHAEIAAQCHKVAGSAVVFGATAISDILKQIENAAKTNDTVQISLHVAKLPGPWDQTKTVMTDV